MGGFRAVIQTDKLQMKFIWGFIIVLSVFYLYYIFNNGGVTVNIAKIPENIFSLSNREGLTVFLIGVTIMNIPTLVSNMSVWQRISGAENVETVVNGFKKSIVSLFLTWTFFVLLACFAFMIVIPENSQSLLSDLLISISDNTIGKIVLFFIVLGMYGAMLSTASTNLIVVSHTISEDIIAKFKSKTTKERLNSKKDFYISRIILTLSTITAILFVVGLKYFGFSIADLVFAIYGGSLTLFPLIMFSLFVSSKKIKQLSTYAIVAVVIGFISGWVIAIYGKIIANSNFVFLSPTISISASFIIIYIGFIITKYQKNLKVKTK